MPNHDPYGDPAFYDLAEEQLVDSPLNARSMVVKNPRETFTELEKGEGARAPGLVGDLGIGVGSARRRRQLGGAAGQRGARLVAKRRGGIEVEGDQPN